MTALTDKHVRVRRVAGFRHEVVVRDHRFAVDEPADLGGTDTAASPLELLAAAVGACTASTIEMYAERKGWRIGQVEVDVTFKPPRSGAQGAFDIVLRLPGELDDTQMETLHSIGRKCPVRRTLEGSSVVERFETA